MNALKLKRTENQRSKQNMNKTQTHRNCEKTNETQKNKNKRGRSKRDVENGIKAEAALKGVGWVDVLAG